VAERQFAEGQSAPDRDRAQRVLASKIHAVRMGPDRRFRKSDFDRRIESRPRSLWLDHTSTPAAVARVGTRRVLVVDDAVSVRDTLCILAVPHYEVEAVPDGLAAIARLRMGPFDLVATDLSLPDVEGIELAREAKCRWPGIEVLSLKPYPAQSSAIDAVNNGLADDLSKPFRCDRSADAGAPALEPASLPARSVHNDTNTADDHSAIDSHLDHGECVQSDLAGAWPCPAPLTLPSRCVAAQ
jgi:CheY-like chemotaxis protein